MRGFTQVLGENAQMRPANNREIPHTTEGASKLECAMGASAVLVRGNFVDRSFVGRKADPRNHTN